LRNLGDRNRPGGGRRRLRLMSDWLSGRRRRSRYRHDECRAGKRQNDRPA
jgi:hypothetical protein